MSTQFAVYLPDRGMYISRVGRLTDDPSRAKQFDCLAWAQKLVLRLVIGETLIRGVKADGDVIDGVRHSGPIEIHTLEAGAKVISIDRTDRN